MVTGRLAAAGLTTMIAITFVLFYSAGRAMRPAGAEATPAEVIKIPTATILHAGPQAATDIPSLAHVRAPRRHRASITDAPTAEPKFAPPPVDATANGGATTPGAVRATRPPHAAPSPDEHGSQETPDKEGGDWSSGN